MPPPSSGTGRTNPLSRFAAALSDRYLLGDEIGRGASAMVYRARDVKHGRSVALKVLRPELASSIGADRFLREVHIAASLTHPHILPILDSAEAEGVLYYVMPLLDGESLRQRIKRERQLSLADAMQVTRDIASGLQYAHDHGVIHRDVKPENILLAGQTSATGGGEAYIADFGLARLAIAASGESLTDSGIAVGTIAYMSPEQGSPGDVVDARTDQYSLACVLFEMLAGVPPYVGSDARAVMARHRLDPVPRITHIRDSIPAGIDDAITRAMAKTPADRFPSVNTFAQALDAAITTDLLARRTGQSPSPSRSATQRSRWVRPAVAAASLLAAVAAAVVWPLSRREARASQRDANLLAVAPFNVPDTSIALWREGLVDVLSRDFDGAGPLRAMAPSAVLAAWHGRADAGAVAAFGRATGAGLVVYGTLLRSGPDSVRLMATLADGVRGDQYQIDIKDELTRIDRMADSATVQLLRLLGATRAIAAVPTASLGSRSFAALKAFLDGEQHYRQNDYRRARELYQTALHLDSTFALANRRLGGVLRAIEGEDYAPSFQYGLRAGEYNHGLSPRDSLLVHADWLAARSVLHGVRSPDDFRAIRERFATLDTAAARYSSDSEVLFERGAATFVYGEFVGRTEREAFDDLTAAIRLDPGFGRPFYGAIDIALSMRGVVAARDLLRRMPATIASGPIWRFFGRLVEDSLGATDAALAYGDSLSPRDVFYDIALTRRWPDERATAIRLAERTRKRVVPADSARAGYQLSRALLFRGRLREAWMTSATPPLLSDPPSLVALGLAGVAPVDSVKRTLTQWKAEGNLYRLILAVPLWTAMRDTISLVQTRVRFDSVLRHPATASDSVQAVIGRGSALAHVALLRGDSAGALKLLQTVPDSLCSWWCIQDRLLTSRLLRRRGDPRAAARALDAHPLNGGPRTQPEVAWLFERGLVAERAAVQDSIANWPIAVNAFAFVARAWGGADAELQPCVAYAREFLASGRRKRWDERPLTASCANGPPFTM